MITESAYWKQPLLDMADRLDQLQRQLTLTEEEFAQLERDLFLGFYSVRKLFEAVGKVGNSTRNAKVEIRQFPKRPSAPTVDWYNRGEIWDLYDLEVGTSRQVELTWLANQIIHSFIFMPSAEGTDLNGETEPDGVFFTSDRAKDQLLSFVATSEVVRIFRMVGVDYPSGLQMRRNPDTGVMDWWVED